ncbi:lycopene cyclase family protein [Frigoriflavimonas asaccharolytica]|uniref:Lycopene beta-cyclase n=1 Tax=Frigoriflavimonas asaccharolytica TaxID=2735899 RepID=A0A8J8K865_9FLAO|nr:lycopene cyclase family protein [Frigoriflavimonas asaccharolytica]NRS92266.1 lycopene beta-cyclase [Frigoriflavimonas asaccharolytica]
MTTSENKYDYIIAGSGAAGLSLLYRILKNSTLNKKKILVIDKAEKNSNDRTWCFWETGKGIFEEVVCNQWKNLEFKTEKFTKEFHLKNYSYKMIQGLDFYQFVFSFAKDFGNVSFLTEPIVNISSEENLAIVETDKGRYSAQYIFNSTTLFNPEINVKNALLQHFTGWVIQTERATFNSEIGTLMDFTLDQKNGATFMYVLPTSSTEALVEYTLFSEKVLEKEAYEIALKKYIREDLKIENFKIKHTEFGIIPMSLAKFERTALLSKNIINIGTAGGFTKASSGYTFQFIQKNTAEIVHNLELDKYPHPAKTFRDKMFDWYDRTLLEVLLSKKQTGKEIFAVMFRKVSPEKIFKFLGNESSIWEDIKIMSVLPIKDFLISGIKQLK